MKKTVLLFGAHSDDQAFGAGATLAKLHNQGYENIICIFSYGEKSHIWMKPHIIKKIREKETAEAGKILGYSKYFFLDVKEGQFMKEKDKLAKEVKKMLTKYKPEKIFLHSSDETHVDHRHLNKIVMGVINETKIESEVYTFDVWNIFSYKRRKTPRYYVGVDKTFGKKIKALNSFKSQKMALITLFWSVYLKAFINGLNTQDRFAEKFLKIK